MKGIDPRARARAKTAARKDGVTLGEWLNRVILDDNDPASAQWDDALESFPGFGGSAALDDDEDRLLRAMVNRLTERVESSEQMSAKTLGNLDRAITQLGERIGKDSQTQSVELNAARDALDRVRKGQDELTDRVRTLESTGGASPTAGRAVETSIMKLARRLYEHENDTAARLHAVDEDSRKSAETLESRLARLEARAEDVEDLNKKREDRTAQTLNGLQTSAEALRSRVEGAERVTNDTARTLENAVGRLDDRLRMLETRNSSDTVELERRFDRLSNEVATIIADTRAQVAKAVDKAAAEPRVERLEGALSQALDRINDAERRQSDSMSRLGEEITKLAGAIDRRLTETERRTADAMRESQSEQKLDRRLDEVREENKVAMRKMGDEVTRLGRALADRIVKSEERANGVVEAATDRMSEILDRFDQTRASDEDLEDRLRQSEERTAQRIAEALTGVQDRMASVRAETEDVLSPVQRAMSALADRLEAIEQRGTDKNDVPASDKDAGPASRADAPEQEDEEEIDYTAPLAPPPQAETPASRFESDEPDPFLTPEPDAPEAPAAPILRERPAEPTPARSDPVTSRPDPVAARTETATSTTAPMPAAPPRPAAPKPPPRVGATADADFLAAARERTRRGDYTATPEPARQRSGLGRSLLYVLPVIALIMLSGAGVLLAWEAIQGDAERQSAERQGGRNFIAQVEAGLATEEAAQTAESTESGPAANTDTALADEAPAQEPMGGSERETAPANMVADATGSAVPASPASDTASRSNADSDATTLESAAASGHPVARYQLGLRALEGGDTATAAILLRRAAEQGVPAAQYRYGKLLESGEGVEINLEEARRWTERAANAGHRRAMHNLGVMYYYGTGTSADTETAARWFQEAALLGLRDSQFNLALLFETGDGVPLSLPDAYAWFTIAAAEGDPVSLQRAETLEEMIEAEARTAARETAVNFTPRPLNAEANGIYRNLPWEHTPSADPVLVRRAQGYLSVLGYTPGPLDGQIGEQTRNAIMQFENDQGLPRTGHIDAVLVERLERAASS